MPFDHEVARQAEDHAVLEGPRLAFVGVADDVVGAAVRLAAEVPLHRGREPGPAAPAQSRAVELGDHLVGRYVDRGADGAAPLHGGEDARPCDHQVGFDARAGEVPVLAELRHHARDLFGPDASHDLAVHERRGRLVAHPDAGRVLEADGAVRGGLPEAHAHRLLEGGGHLGQAMLPLHHALGEADDRAAFGLAREEIVERRRVVHLDFVDAEGVRDLTHGLVGDEPVLGLNLTEDVQKPVALPPVAGRHFGDAPDLAHATSYDVSAVHRLVAPLSISEVPSPTLPSHCAHPRSATNARRVPRVSQPCAPSSRKTEAAAAALGVPTLPELLRSGRSAQHGIASFLFTPRERGHRAPRHGTCLTLSITRDRLRDKEACGIIDVTRRLFVRAITLLNRVL